MVPFGELRVNCQFTTSAWDRPLRTGPSTTLRVRMTVEYGSFAKLRMTEGG
jgi:hypothetical protein